MIQNVCAVCGGVLTTLLLVHDTPDRFERAAGVPEADYRREWRACSSCGSATNCQAPANVQRLEAIASNYYEVDFAGSDIRAKHELVMSLPAEKSDNAGRVARIRHALDRWAGLRPDRAVRSVLDIGAGTGVFVARFLAECGTGWCAVAVEPDPHAAEFLRSLRSFEVIEGVYEGQPELSGFNLVTLNKVLEHLPKPKFLLETVARAMDPAKGLLYVEVPDVLTIGRRAPSNNILGALHHHLYTPKGLLAVLENAGLVPLEVGRIFEPSGKLTVYAFAVQPEAVERMAGTN